VIPVINSASHKWSRPKGEKGLLRERRVCRSGCGVEADAGKCNTPGFKLRTSPKVVRDLRGFLRLDLQRKNRRIVQSSLALAYGWRANCDVQMLIYESNPDCPDPGDVTRVTDYIVAYACKGVESLTEEREQTKSLILSAKEDAIGKQDVQRVARKALNRSLGEKLVSKQEAMVQLARLDLFLCSEMITSVSLSGYYKLGTAGEGSTTVLAKYARRDLSRETVQNQSLHSFFLDTEGWHDKQKKYTIPHFTGASCTPVYPPTTDYARAVLLTHQPWHRKFIVDDRDFLSEFWDFIQSPLCPSIVKVPFFQVYMRHLSKKSYVEPTSNAEGISYEEFSQDIPDDLALAVTLVSNLSGDAASDNEGYEFDYGVDHDWTQCRIKVTNMEPHDISQWLPEQVSEFRSQENSHGKQMTIPQKNDGTTYELKDLNDDQRDIAQYILQGVRDWICCSREKRMNDFNPVRLTVRGVAGSGKSTLIHTLSTAVKRMFSCDSVVCINGPTGCCAFSVGGKTIHSAWSIAPFQAKMIPSAEAMKKLFLRYSNLVLLMVDERSMISSSLLASLESYAKQTVHMGQNNKEPWGFTPVVVFFGDDGQLPPVEPGAFYAFDKKPTNMGNEKLKMRYRGEYLFLQLGRDVMQLKTSMRQDPSQLRFHRILRGLRAENSEDALSEVDIQYLHSFLLHPDNDRFTKLELQTISERSTWLFANKAPRDQRNLKKMYELHSALNPVVRIHGKPETTRILDSHFGEDSILRLLRCCIGCRVSICARNINPDWALFNGSIGIVIDIVFASGQSPHNRDLPLYILVDFDQYCGPRFHESLPETYVPIVPETIGCTRNCCRMTQIPLRLAFAKTIHTFQGANVGPMPPGSPPNMIQSIVVDPGNRGFEGNNPGLFYTLASRGTTLGDQSDNLSSALFFTGKNMNPDRIRSITTGSNGHKYTKILKRERWVNYLEKNTRQLSTTKGEQDALFTWIDTTRIPSDELLAIITSMTTRNRLSSKII
jgi:hypothetical protein